MADVFQSRPNVDQIAAFHQWGADAREKMMEAMGRKNSPVLWAALVLDECGLLAVVRESRRGLHRPLDIASADGDGGARTPQS